MMLIGANAQRLIGIEIAIETHFHASDTARKKVNCILCLEDDSVNKVSDGQGLLTLAQ